MVIIVAVFLLGGAGGLAAAKLASSPVTDVQVSYEEIYETFQCPCCGQPISADCCQLAIERKGYATGLIDAGLDRMQVMEKYVARYGIDSFRNDTARAEFREYMLKKAPRDRPVVEVSPESADLGNVSIAGGEVVTTFQVKNAGKNRLVITNLATSCGCTTAALVVRGVEGPRFGMDMGQGSGPAEWEAELSPGETATLKVYYDPRVHEDLRGFVIREVYIYSNDPVDPVVKVRISLNQVE